MSWINEEGVISLDTTQKEWTGTPLDRRDNMDPNGVLDVTIVFGNGDKDIFRARQRDEFASYELHMMAAYIDGMAHSIRKGQKR
ncbi:hypothetical protein BH24ACT22_BH24ACT22_19670 [soil metagenome]